MGWNELHVNRAHPVLRHVRSGDEVYFVHSYYPDPGNERDVLATSRYGVEFAAVIGARNIIATQFHVEKSGPVGLKILSDFVDWDGDALLSKRLISCLDVRDGRLVKSVRFVNTKDIGDPVSAARRYYEAGLDELVFYDITASSDQRGIMLDVVEEVARQVFIPFSVGGGLRSVEDCRRVLRGRRGEGQPEHGGRSQSRSHFRSGRRIRCPGRRAVHGREGISFRGHAIGLRNRDPRWTARHRHGRPRMGSTRRGPSEQARSS